MAPTRGQPALRLVAPVPVGDVEAAAGGCALRRVRAVSPPRLGYSSMPAMRDRTVKLGDTDIGKRQLWSMPAARSGGGGLEEGGGDPSGTRHAQEDPGSTRAASYMSPNAVADVMAF
jgi:hypothetical protein